MFSCLADELCAKTMRQYHKFTKSVSSLLMHGPTALPPRYGFTSTENHRRKPTYASSKTQDLGLETCSLMFLSCFRDKLVALSFSSAYKDLRLSSEYFIITLSSDSNHIHSHHYFRSKQSFYQRSLGSLTSPTCIRTPLSRRLLRLSASLQRLPQLSAL